jgi:hypothetical protein
MEQMNGDETGAVSSASVLVAPVESAPHNGTSALDPGGIGRRVEQEVNALLETAQADADRIRAKAIAGIRMAEAKLSAMQQQMASTLAQLSELAERIEPGRRTDLQPVGSARPTAEAQQATERRSLAERFAANGSRPAERPVPSVFDPPSPKEERPAPSIPPSEEIVRILREHLT